MKISLFLSVENDESGALFMGRQAALACASEKLAANIVPHFSSLKDEKSDNYHIEYGCRIDLLSVAVNQLPDVLYLWRRLRDLLGIHCMYVEVRETSDIVYSGCICNWPYYWTDYRLIHINGPITCSCGPAMLPDPPASITLPSDKLRNGKPLC